MSSSPGRGREPSERLVGLLREIVAATEPDLALAPEQQLRSALHAYFDVVERHAETYRELYRDALGTDPELQEFVDASLDRQAERLFALLAPDVRAREMVRLAVHGWFRFLIDVCLRWLETRTVERDALCDVCVDTLFSAVASATRAATPDEW
jgi:AcrR family transcriptional regulator